MELITPKNNTALFGHEQALARLTQALEAKRLAHGLIISGPKGIGKATLAYHFTRQLLSSPQRIAAGSHSDLLVVECAYDDKKDELKNEISVEQAREVAAFLSLTPAEGDWRVVIIDSADALNSNAANAILKILEEPPPQAILMLIAHHPARLLPTIRSRCQHIKLAPLSDKNFTRAVCHISPEMDPTELAELRSLADHSPGLALAMKAQGALELYAELLELVKDLPALDAARVHRFADTLSGGKAHEQWQLLTHLALHFLAQASKTARAPYPPHVWAEKWQACADQFSLAQARHLDYKQVMITWLHSLSEHAFLPHHAHLLRQ